MKGKTGKEKGESNAVLASTGPGGRKKSVFFSFSFVVGWPHEEQARVPSA
jgi:hypothetical protein